MSKRIPVLTAGSLLCALAVSAHLSGAASAGNSKASSEPNVAPSNKKVVVQKPSVPSSLPVPPVLRTPASFTPQMTLGEAVDILRNCTTPPLNIVVLWRDLGDNAGIYRETPIGIDGIPGLRVGQYLDLLVLSLSASAPVKISYRIHGGAVVIGTTDGLPVPKMVTRVYDVSDLVAEPAQYFFPPFLMGGMGFGGLMVGPLNGYGPGASYPGGSTFLGSQGTMQPGLGRGAPFPRSR
jgi:hypothetical protein